MMKKVIKGSRWLLGLLVILLMAGMLWGCATTSSTRTAQTESEFWFDKSDETYGRGYGRG